MSHLRKISGQDYTTQMKKYVLDQFLTKHQLSHIMVVNKATKDKNASNPKNDVPRARQLKTFLTNLYAVRPDIEKLDATDINV